MPTCNACGKEKPDHTFAACPDCRARWRKSRSGAREKKTIDTRSVTSFICAVATCRRQNTAEWMEFIRDEANALLEKIGSPERLTVSRDGFQIVRKS